MNANAKKPDQAARELAQAGATISADNLAGCGCDPTAARAFVAWLNSRNGERTKADLAKLKRAPKPQFQRDRQWTVTQQIGGRAGRRRGLCR